MPKYKKEGNPGNHNEEHDALKEGFVECGSPYQYPQDDQEGKPERPGHLTSRDSRLHSRGNRTGSSDEHGMPCCGSELYFGW